MPRKPPARRSPTLTDGTVRVILVLIAVAARAPFFHYFNFVTYDGTYYINQARALLHGALAGGSFPIGYPLVVAPLLAIVRDGVLAGRLVSILAGIGSVLVLFELGRTRVSRLNAALGAAVLAVTPLFIQVTLLTLSESVYTFWVLLALLWFGRERYVVAGLAMGMAAATRPEALGVTAALGVVLLWRWLRVHRVAPRQVMVFASGFAIVYAVSVVAMSIPQGSLTLLSRSGAYHSKNVPWMLRETSLEFEGKKKAETQIRESWGSRNPVVQYVIRVPGDVGRLAAHMLIVIPLLALFGLQRRRDYVLAAFAPLLVIPLFTERGALRWMVPYTGPLILYGVVGLDGLRRKGQADLARAAVVVCAGLAFWVDHGVFHSGIEDAMRPVRAVAEAFASRVSPGDRIADRKPYFAFYAGGQYVEIPIAPYDEAMAWMAKHDVKYLSLFQPSIHNLRPAMRPLLYDRAAIRGELRYRQVLFDVSGEIVYERERDADPLTERALKTQGAEDIAPEWSPDGKWIAFRRNHEKGPCSICVTDAQGDSVRTVVDVARVADYIAWAPDGRSILYSDVKDNNQDLYTVDLRTKKVTRLTRDPARDYAPSWCWSTGEIFFGSDRGGTPGVWAKKGIDGKPARISDPGTAAGPPAASPSGRLIGWTDAQGRFVLFDREKLQQGVLTSPTGILSAPSWNPAGDVVAVGAYDWSSGDIYLISARTGRSLRLTKKPAGKSMPSWSPDGNEIAIVSAKHDSLTIHVLGNLGPYLTRLNEVEDVKAFKRPADTRSQPPAP